MHAEDALGLMSLRDGWVVVRPGWIHYTKNKQEQ